MFGKFAKMNGLDVMYTSIQGRYAKALFDCGNQNGKLQKISDDFEQLSNLLVAHKKIKKIIYGDVYNKTTKDQLIQQIGESLSFCNVFINFIRLLAENKRFDLLSKIRYVYQRAYNRQKHIRNVTVCSVIELNETQQMEANKLAKNFLGQDIIIEYKIDKRILGGIKIMSDEIVVDATLATQIRQLANHLRKTRIEVKYEN